MATLISSFLKFFIVLVIFGASVLGIATASIGIRVYNKCPQDSLSSTEDKNNKNFLIIMLSTYILFVFMSFGITYAIIKSGGSPVNPQLVSKAQSIAQKSKPFLSRDLQQMRMPMFSSSYYPR